VELIEKHGRGLLSLLDEECKVPKGNDAGFLEKANKQHSRNTAFGVFFFPLFFLSFFFSTIDR
jgi:myosin heavy subunit